MWYWRLEIGGDISCHQLDVALFLALTWGLKEGVGGWVWGGRGEGEEGEGGGGEEEEGGHQNTVKETPDSATPLTCQPLLPSTQDLSPRPPPR